MLITLGIIGVIAALTISPLIAKYKKFVLANQLKKSYSVLSQALLATKLESGQSIAYYKYFDGTNYTRAQEFKKLFYKNANVVNDNNKYDIVWNYNHTKSYSYNGVDWPTPTEQLKDGSAIVAVITSNRIFISADVNGIKNKPNQYGHDIFKFYVDQNYNLLPIKTSRTFTDEELESMPYPEQQGYPCSKHSKQIGNGIGCAYFAMKDICPDDPKKGYWECLP